MKLQPPNRVLKISCFCLISVVVIFFLGFSTIVNFVVRDQTALRSRNLMRKFYLKLPISLDFKIYFFNISNPFEVQQGQIPKLVEIGPYHYDAYKEKIDVLENEGEDSLTYTPYETYFFNQDNSAPLRDDDYVTILHPLIVGVVNQVMRDSPPLIPIVNRAIKSLFKEPQTLYLTVKVKDILFNGILLDCSVNDYAAKAVCSQLKTQISQFLREIKKNVYKFSILTPRNGTIPMRYKVFRGIKKSKDLGRLVELNHEKELTLWSTKRCNTFRGTDSWIFPPFVSKEEGIWTYSPDLCRNIHAVYQEDLEYHKVFVEKYYADIGDMNIPDEKCYCPKTCLSKGVMDLTKCMGVPIYATLPHFLRTDETLLNQVEGLNPVTDQHIIRILMQPLLGVPMSAQKRMQFNLPIQKIPKIDLMKSLPKALHPIFWIEEEINLDGFLLKMIKAIFISLKVFDILKYVFLAAALGGVGYGGFLQFKLMTSIQVENLDKEVREVTNAKSNTSNNNNDGLEVNNVEEPEKLNKE